MPERTSLPVMKPDDFWEVPTDELRKLSGAFSDGVLSHGITKTALGKVWKGDFPTGMEAILALNDAGWTPSQLAYLLDQIVAARNEEDRFSHLLDLVISGPEVTGVNMRATGAVFQEMVSTAEEEILMASFAIYNGQNIFKPLVQRWEERPELSVKLFLDIPRPRHDTTLESALVARYRKRFVEKEWPGETLPELYHFLPALESNPAKRASMHAKIVVVDRREAFVSSANFTNAAQTKNIEVGVKISQVSSANLIRDFFLGALETGQFQSF